MKSNDVFREVFKKHSVKEITGATGSKEAYVYKWSQRDGGKGSGGWNPLERIVALMRLTKDLRPLHWLCQQMGGYFVANPKAKNAKPKEFFPAENETVEEFGDLISDITRFSKDGRITREEAAIIRKRWEELKSVTEGFVHCCEKGSFQFLQMVSKQPATASAGASLRTMAR